MADPLIEIPDKPAFKAAEVCEIAHIPAYVLRSWEKEFPGLGVAPKPGGPRIYRRGDIEQILRIKQLVFSEGLTLAGARRRLEGEPPPEPEPAFPVPDEVKARVGQVKQELRSLLQLLGSGPASQHFARPDPSIAAVPLAPPQPAPPVENGGGGWPPTFPAGPSGAAEAATKLAPAVVDDEPALPLMDAEAETSTAPPAVSVPAPARRRKKT